ncbi:MAG: hypothetical protein HYZ79_01885 [Candidatus Melainabacteria bacterium]|nr:hypothetical protein [Candidatus Melainabacteria bacterium]
MVKPYPLGNDGRVVYLGKEHSGDGIIAPSYDKYYYGTDLAPKELAGFFHAFLSHPSGDSRSYDLTLPSGKSATLMFFKDKHDPDDAIPNWSKNVTKKNVFYIIDDNYDTLKSNL